MAATILKVSVLGDGSLLLDGSPVDLSSLAAALDAAPEGNAAVWYYRENAAGEAPPAALQAMKLITDRRLPIRLSTKPDFSDAVTPASSAIERVFAAIRERAAERQLVILRPDGKPLAVPAPPRESVPPEQLAGVDRILPSSVPRRVAVIGDTAWSVAAQPNLREAASAIPFFGLLMGLSVAGHAVWIFDAATPATLAAGCRDADLVIVDSAKLADLPPDWPQTASGGARRPQILVHDRATYRLRPA